MTHPAENAAGRLLTAINDFIGQELLALQSGNIRLAHAVHRRCAPLIARLCELGSGRPAWWTARLSRELAAVRARRAAVHTLLAQAREHLTAERQRLAATRGRLFSVAPAYATDLNRPLSRLHVAV